MTLLSLGFLGLAAACCGDDPALAEIRDLILDRLRHFRQAGLGDPDDHNHAVAVSAHAEAPSDDAIAAAREVLAEARALRQTLTPV